MTRGRVFIDANIPLYVAGRELPSRGPARRFMEGVHAGSIDACTSTEVLQEILHRYVGLRRQDLAQSVYDLFVQICPTVLPVTLADTDRARDLACASSTISVRDAIHAAVMINNGIGIVATFDTGFDAIEGIERAAMR